MIAIPFPVGKPELFPELIIQWNGREPISGGNTKRTDPEPSLAFQLIFALILTVVSPTI